MLKQLALLLLLASAVMAPAGASIINYDVPLDGIQSGTGSPGTGSASLTLDTVANTLFVDLTFSGLLAPTSNAHIHCCASPGSNAGVIIPFLPFFPLGVTSGSLSHLFALTPAQVTDVQSFQSYINIHTTLHPGGEIRGQITPEPATFGLVGALLAGVVVLRRRR